MIYYDHEVMTNLLGVSNMFKKGNEVYINNQKENFLIVTNKDGFYKCFPCADSDLYVRDTAVPID